MTLLKQRVKATCFEVDFSVSTAEGWGRVGQWDQQGGILEEGQDLDGLESAMNRPPAVILLSEA